MAQTERVALLALYHATGGPAWTRNANWDTDFPISQWYGVTVIGDRVVELDLMSNNLLGDIPPQLGDLRALEALDLSLNKLNGTIPEALGNLSALVSLWLSNNSLEGPIPRELKKLAALRALSLSSNQLSGPIPKELADLTELKELWLYNNNLTGKIPASLGELVKLETLNLRGNKLSGHIPPELGKVSALKALDLSFNKLDGPIPKDLGNLKALTTLKLQSNSLEDNIHVGAQNLDALTSSDFGWIARQGSVDRSKDDGTGPPSVVRVRQPYRGSYIGKGRALSRGDSGSSHGSDRGSSHGSSAESAASDRGWYDFRAARSSKSADDKRAFMDRILQATALQEPNESRMSGALGEGTAKKVTLVENLEGKDTPCVRKGGGVRVSVPRNARSSRGIGPITVEEASEVVKGSNDSVYVVLKAVHCRPPGTTFLEPLTLDFAVRDGRVWWWDRAAVREEVLREYQILSKQSEDDPWQLLDLQDVSVVWDDQGSTCVRARIRHFTWFSLARRTTTASGNVVSRHWDKSVLVVNATNSVAHITPMPISFNTSKEATKACSLTFCEAGVSFEVGRRTEQIMLPVNISSEIIPAGGSAVLFLSGGAREMKIIVCFLPDRNKAKMSPSNQTVSPSSGTSPVPRTTSSPVIQTIATGTQQGTTTHAQTSTAAAPSSGGSPPLGAGPLVRVTLSTLEVAARQSDGQGTSPRESEEMVYSMTKVLPGRRRLTLLQASVNRKINIEPNARALETYAMMLADFGTAPP